MEFNLLPNFSGHNTLYTLLEASRELTVLHFLLPTPAVFLLPFPCVFPNNFWLYGPTFHIRSMFYLLPFLYPRLLHLGLSLDLPEVLPYSLLFPYILLLFSMLFVPPFLHIIPLLLAVHFPPDAPHFSPTFFPPSCSASGFCLALLPFLAILQWWLAVLLPQPASS